MIISLHLPKTAGTSFGSMLKACYGHRLFLDYGDLIGDESESSVALRANRAAGLPNQKTTMLSDYDVIHGHFYASKYVEIFPDARFITTLRDPFTRLPSHYQYLRRCNVPGHALENHPLVRSIRENNMSFDDFTRWDYMKNLFSRLLHPLDIFDFHFVGIQEHYELSLHLLAGKMNIAPSRVEEKNVNQETNKYPLTWDQARTIARLHSDDISMYLSAVSRFHEELRISASSAS